MASEAPTDPNATADPNATVEPFTINLPKWAAVAISEIKVDDTGRQLPEVVESPSPEVVESPSPAPIVSKLTISIPESTETYFGKTVAELGTFTLDPNQGYISGVSNYVSGYTEFSSIESEQSGNYVVVRVALPDDIDSDLISTATVTYGTDSE